MVFLSTVFPFPALPRLPLPLMVSLAKAQSSSSLSEESSMGSSLSSDARIVAWETVVSSSSGTYRRFFLLMRVDLRESIYPVKEK